MHLVSCFIKKNTPELIEKVVKLGYKYSNQYDKSCDSLHTRIESTYSPAHFVDEHYIDLNPSDGIDCNDNEELFLALAALRDDTDKNQWFVIPKVRTLAWTGFFPQILGMDGHDQVVDGYEWVLIEEDGITESIREAIYSGENPEFLPHKASIDELKQYFSNDR